MSGETGNERARMILKVILLIGVLYMFFVSIELMGSTFKLFGKGFAEQLLKTTAHPIVGLFIGILATSVIQSSSTTTSIVVGLVAAGGLSITNAVPIIMGANIGTSVTNTIVSLGHITRRSEFKRAIAGATVHDFFNLLTVVVLLPLEIAFGYLQTVATFLEKIFEGIGGLTLVSPLKLVVKPAIHFAHHIFLQTFGFSEISGGVLMLVLSLAALFFALKKIVDIMKEVVIGRVEKVINEVLFQSALRSFLIGIFFTALVQSSSVTTSLIVPMIGAGILTVERFFPYTMGANIGTTITAIMASLVTGNPAAVTVAFVHLCFNITGCVIFYPLRKIPIAMAEKLGEIASERRWMAIGYIATTFFIIPSILIVIAR